MLKLIVLCLLMVGCAGPLALRDGAGSERYSPPPGSIVLRVQVLETEFTDLYPGCAEPNECVPFHFWYKYRARVKEVVSGEWTKPEVEFARLQHAEFVDRIKRDCYVVLRPAGPNLGSLLHVPFEADRLVSRLMDGGPTEIRALRAAAERRGEGGLPR
ncbi:hypothetical protein V7787_24580 [Pseudomonas sp. CGJS7]